MVRGQGKGDASAGQRSAIRVFLSQFGGVDDQDTGQGLGHVDVKFIAALQAARRYYFAQPRAARLG